MLAAHSNLEKVSAGCSSGKLLWDPWKEAS